MQTNLATVIGWVIVALIGALGVTVILKIWSGAIDLSGLLAEPRESKDVPAKASLSRLQFLIFTFVVAGLYLTLCLEAGEFLEIPSQVLGLLGISGGSYVLSKGIQANKDKQSGDKTQ